MTLVYRVSSERDLERIVEMKRAMFLEIDFKSNDLKAEFAEMVLADYIVMNRENRVRHFLATDDDMIVACAGAFIRSDEPIKYFRNDRYGYIGDVYTEPDFRGQGLAKMLCEKAVDYLKEQGMATIELKASSAGRSIYESLGFSMSDYHMLLDVK